MALRMTSSVLLLILAGGMLAGTPIFSGNDRNGMSAMKCCKKQQMEPLSVAAARLCCAVNCSNPAPTSSTGAFNFSASAYTVSDALITQIASLLKRDNSAGGMAFPFERKVARSATQPRYIQYNSFLI